MVTGLVANLWTQLRPLTSSLEQVRASAKSADIAKADDQSDRDFQVFKDSLRPYRTIREETEQADYTSLKTLLDQQQTDCQDQPRSPDGSPDQPLGETGWGALCWPVGGIWCEQVR